MLQCAPGSLSGSYGVGATSSCSPCQVAKYGPTSGLSTCIACPGNFAIFVPHDLDCCVSSWLLLEHQRPITVHSVPERHCYPVDGSNFVLQLHGVSTVCQQHYSLVELSGTYTDTTGQLICKSCPAGSLNSFSGLSSCSSCPAGQDSLAPPDSITCGLQASSALTARRVRRARVATLRRRLALYNARLAQRDKSLLAAHHRALPAMVQGALQAVFVTDLDRKSTRLNSSHT